jgi:D-3-phosphoglycerate dehydrogenase
MINDQALAQFKPGAVLINTARGGLIDDDALVRALKSGKLSSAALDSFTVEPLTAPHIWQSVENVIITPHIGGVSDNSYVKMGTASVTNLLKVLAQKEATV